MAGDDLIYVQSYNVGLDEMVNLPFRRDAELPQHIFNAYGRPVPWRRMVNRATGEIEDAPDPEWCARAQNPRTRNLKDVTARVAWYAAHPNLLHEGRADGG